jgi:hypothetical protein
MEGWGVGRWVVVRDREDLIQQFVSIDRIVIRKTEIERGKKTYLGHLDVASAAAQKLCVLWHQHGAGVVSRGVEERVGGASSSRGAQSAGELGNGGSNARHCCCVDGEKLTEMGRKDVKVYEMKKAERACGIYWFGWQISNG